MGPELAIVAGSGALPHAIAGQAPGALYVTFAGMEASPPPGARHFEARFERLGALFDRLRAAGVERVVFAGAMHRPAPDPARFDALTREIMPGLLEAMRGGDDRLLRRVAALFEGQGLAVCAAAQVAPGLLPDPGWSAGPAPEAGQLADERRARAILETAGALDLGQAVVVEAGLCLGVETLQGTDALLDFVAATPPRLRRGRGVLLKAPKPGQDLRIDMPTIGPETLRGVARAGLAGIFIARGGVLVLERAEVTRLAAAHGLFVAVR